MMDKLRRISQKKRLTIVILAVVIIATTAYLWFREVPLQEVPLQVQINDIALDPQAYDDRLVEVEGRLIRYGFGWWEGYGLTDGITKIPLLGYEKEIVNSDWVGPFDQYLDEYVVIIGRFEYDPYVLDAPRLTIKISKLSISSPLS